LLLSGNPNSFFPNPFVGRETVTEATMPIDPVCKMEVSVADAAASHDFHNETLYFCSIDCLKKFEADPAKYMDNMSDEELIA
jgi:YHS domain-containing protein